MGLDMYMYKVTKLTKKEEYELIGVKEEQIWEKGYYFLPKETCDANLHMYQDLLPLSTLIPVICKYYDYDRLFAEHGKSEDDVSGFGANHFGNIWFFRDGSKLSITTDELESYAYEKEDEIYFWKSEQIGYWRNHHSLQNFIEKVYHDGRKDNPDIKNCGYHFLDDDMKKKIKKSLSVYDPELTSSLDLKKFMTKNIYYHSWW